MKEKEKRDYGMLYDAVALLEESLQCKDLCFEYNNLHPSQLEKKQALIRTLFGKTKQAFLAGWS